MGNCEHLHTPLPSDYVGRQEAFIELMKTHVQKRCPECKRWAVWVPKDETT